MFVQLWSSFSEELKTAKQKIIHGIVMKDIFVKKKKKKRYKIIGIAIVESTEIIYYVTKQNLHFAHSPCHKN